MKGIQHESRRIVCFYNVKIAKKHETVCVHSATWSAIITFPVADVHHVSKEVGAPTKFEELLD